MTRVGLLLVLAILGPACGDDDAGGADAPVGPDAAPPMLDAMWAVEQRTFDMPVGAIAEAEVMMTTGSTLRSDFTAGETLEWNLHTHVAGVTTTLAEGEAAAHIETHVATADGPIWLMWRNPPGSATTSVTVTITLSEGASFTGWE